jgi:hypothetical protein
MVVHTNIVCQIRLQFVIDKDMFLPFSLAFIIVPAAYVVQRTDILWSMGKTEQLLSLPTFVYEFAE